MESPGTPPRSAGRAALPYMGIKRTAPRDWSRPGTRAGRPRPNAFQTVSAAAAAAAARDVPLRDRRTGPPSIRVTCRLDARAPAVGGGDVDDACTLNGGAAAGHLPL